MEYMRKKTVSNFSKEQLLQMVKECLNELDIPYAEEPGGFGVEKLLDPTVLDAASLEIFTIRMDTVKELDYRPKYFRTYSSAVSSDGLEDEMWNGNAQAVLAA